MRKESFDPAAGEVDVFPQDITRVLLNLISNGFYAATRADEFAATSGAIQKAGTRGSEPEDGASSVERRTVAIAPQESRGCG